MPHLHNGIGTWYYGKRNLQQYPGVCKYCGKPATLKTYDTRLYFVIFLIPIIPLKRKHIIEQCSACKRHGVLPRGKWVAAQKQMEEAISAWRTAPTDRKKAIVSLVLIETYREFPRFQLLAPEIEKVFPRDGEVLSALANLNDSFGIPSESERLLRQAMLVDDSEVVREAVAESLLKQCKPDEAEPYLQHIVARRISDRVGPLYSLAQGFQKQAMHDKALTVFAQCEIVRPSMSEDPTFQQLRQASAEQLGTDKPVEPTKVVRKIKSAAARRKFMKIAPIVLAILFAAFALWSLILQMRSPVYLVNGLERAYTARINGVAYKLPPGDAQKIRLPEGKVTVSIDGAPATIPPETITFHSSFWKRMFDNHVFVINPDGAVLLRDTKVFYADKSHDASEPENTFAGGQTLFSFDEIDYPFQPSPASIELDSDSSVEHRHELAIVDQAHKYPQDVVFMVASEQIGEDAAMRIAQRHLLLEPEVKAYQNVVAALNRKRNGEKP